MTPYHVVLIEDGKIISEGARCRDKREALRWKIYADKLFPNNKHAIEYISPDGSTRELIE